MKQQKKRLACGLAAVVLAFAMCAMPVKSYAANADDSQIINGELTKQVYVLAPGQYYITGDSARHYLYYADCTQSPYYAVYDSTNTYLLAAMLDTDRANTMVAQGSLDSVPAEAGIALYDSSVGYRATNETFLLTDEMRGSGIYSGWHQEPDGRFTYYDPDTHQKITGCSVDIGGVAYRFDGSGYMVDSSNGQSPYVMTNTQLTHAECIDVSNHKGVINWAAVKASGVKYAVVRVGYRGYETGVLQEDSYAARNIREAHANGIKVGLYVFDQAVNEGEAAEEANLAIRYAQSYGCDMPIFIDSESGNPAHTGRADTISADQRTNNVVTFCETVKAAGYTPGVYASATWFGGHLTMSRISGYKLWVADYRGRSAPGFSASWYMWQYSSAGMISGVNGRVDVNRMG